jgi:hypothetical protein
VSAFFARYFFLALSLLCLAPGALVSVLRPDLRAAMLRVTPWALPFAATEWLFFPAYWQPTFLFDLGDRIGFGVEDVLYVTGLAHLGTTIYWCAARKGLAPRGAARTTGAPPRGPRSRAVPVLGLTFLVFMALMALRVPVLWASVCGMGAAAACVALDRRDLLLPMLLGGALGGGVYGALCLVHEVSIPGVFARHWRTEGLVGRTLFGVPLGELLYATGASAAATGFYPWVYDLTPVPLP